MGVGLQALPITQTIAPSHGGIRGSTPLPLGKILPLNFILSLHKDLSYENNAIVMKKETEFIVKTGNVVELRI